MTAPPLWLAARLLQTPGGLEEVGEAVARGREVPVGPLLLLAGVLLVGLALRSLWLRVLGGGGRGGAGGSGGAGGGPPEPPPLWTAWRITRACGVSLRGRLLLLRIARRSPFPDPLPLLAASGTLYHHGRQYAAGLPVGRRRRVLRGLSRLQRELYGEGRPAHPAPEAPAPPAAPPPDRRSRPRSA